MDEFLHQSDELPHALRHGFTLKWFYLQSRFPQNKLDSCKTQAVLRNCDEKTLIMSLMRNDQFYSSISKFCVTQGTNPHEPHQKIDRGGRIDEA